MDGDESDLCEKHLPKWLIAMEDKILVQKFVIRPKCTFFAILTARGHYYEAWDREIVREYCLDGLEVAVKHPLVPARVSMQLFFAYSKRKSRQVFYLIQCDEKLFIVERLKDSLELRRTEDFISSVNIEDRSGEGNCTVNIMRTDGISQEIAFLDEDEMESDEKEDESSGFLLQCLESRNRKLESDLEMRRKLIQEELHKIRHVGKYGPPEMSTGVSFSVFPWRFLKGFSHLKRTSFQAPDEAAPLVKYGEVWLKLHNDRIVFGIPIFNTTYSRRRVALNVRPLLANSQLDRLSYEFKLYKIRNDSCTIENFDEFFDCDEPSYANSVDFQHEWTPLEENCLQPGLPAILVTTTQVMDFSKFSLYKFAVYVQYEIKHEAKVYQLQFMAGEVEIPLQILFKAVFTMERDEKKFFYRNLLAIASTSLRKVIHMESGSEISCRFYQFLMDNLKFHRIVVSENSMNESRKSDEVSHELMDVDENDDVSSYFIGGQKRAIEIFYQRDDFFRGGLIRVQEINKSNFKLKIYMRTENHLAAFLQIMKTEFDKNVSFSEEKDPQSSCAQLRSLLDEINSKKKLLTVLQDEQKDERKYREAFKEVFHREFKTDCVFQKVSVDKRSD
ncbi:uncharacterized protein LOC132261102 [Phlebotomus argentipes]|uniref:uncharacterized protein LOC132261102 n=1 Tax=Phlebotomus argentipes TaxID=94469 RepID=UPI0028936698|nr:uncharacterized protein LOC132261102 [Phlebotomus argentipes]